MSKTDDLPDLTPKQFAFVQRILAGDTASDAYRHAYNVENTTDEVVWVRASELRNNGKVKVWLSRARQEALTEATMTKEAYLQELTRLARECEKTANYGAAVKATELAGKVMGHYVDRHEDVGVERGLADVLARIETKDKALARALASRLGLSDEDSPTIQ